MPNYFYIAKSFEGQDETGFLDAIDERHLAKNLKSRGFVLIKAVLESKKNKNRFELPSFLGISLSEKIMMIKNLGVMFSTGLPLVKSIDILASQAKNKKLKSALLDAKEKVNKGENLSDALGNYPHIFSELFVNMIKVGEESGTLDEIFQILSLQLIKENELRSRIKNAMIYPSIILMVMFVVGIVVINFVIPNLNVFFTTLNVDIPIYTKILIYSGNYLSQRWYLLFVVPLFIFIFIYTALKSKKGKKFIDTLLLKMPVISPIVKKSNSAFLIRSLSSLMASGVPLTRSLEISSKTIGNYYFKEAALEANKKIKKGEKLSDALRTYQNIFPIGVIEMMEVGEETGKTSEVLKKLADFYEQEAASAVEKLSILIEPILIIILGLGVAIFAFSIIEPMYSSIRSISQ